MTSFQNPLGALVPDDARKEHKGLVLNCGSFSKSLAPGYRIGWVAAGRFARSVGRRKIMSSLSTNIPAQDAIALYLRQGGYDRHLGVLRRASGPSSPWEPSCDHSRGEGVRLRLSYMG
jgi:DNA-binding transcriptional MocR family regulator